jgi:hypothetical protein
MAQDKEKKNPFKWVDEYLEQIAEGAKLDGNEKEALSAILKDLEEGIAELRKKARRELKEELGDKRLGELEGYLHRFFDRRDGPIYRPGRKVAVPQGIAEFTRQVVRELDLEPATQEKVLALSLRLKRSARFLFLKVHKGGPEAYAKAIAQVRKEMDDTIDRMKEDLTDEQKEKLDGLYKEFGKRFWDPGAGGGN